MRVGSPTLRRVTTKQNVKYKRNLLDNLFYGTVGLWLVLALVSELDKYLQALFLTLFTKKSIILGQVFWPHKNLKSYSAVALFISGNVAFAVDNVDGIDGVTRGVASTDSPSLFSSSPSSQVSVAPYLTHSSDFRIQRYFHKRWWSPT